MVMETDAFTHYLLKVFSAIENRIAERVLFLLKEENRGIAGTPAVQEKLLTDKQVCDHLQISVSHFHNFKKAHAGFPSYAIGKNVRYKLSEVEKYITNIKQHDRRN